MEIENEWKQSVDNKLSIHFGADKTNCILFSKTKLLSELNVTCDNNRIKQFDIVEQLGCCFHAHLCEESMAMKPLTKINIKLQFL